MAKLKRLWTRKSFYINIALLVVAAVFVLLSAIFTFIYFDHRGILISAAKTRTVEVNTFVATQIEGDEIENFTKTLEKNDYYFKLNSMLYRLKATFGITYLYILADDGTPGRYMYIFDARLDESASTYSDAAYGTYDDRSVFPGSEAVFSSVRAFSEAQYSESQEYGRLFYSYAPITNSKGDVVAFLGTDFDAEATFRSIGRYLLSLLASALASFIVVSAVIILYCRAYISHPILRLSRNIASFSKGELELEIPPELLTRTDELGLIYRAFAETIHIITHLITDLGRSATTAVRGALDVDIKNPNAYQGSFGSIVRDANLLLQNNRRLLDMIPSTIFFFDQSLRELYHNEPAKMLLNSAESSAGDPAELRRLCIDALRGTLLAFSDGDSERFTGAFTISLPNLGARHFNVFLIKNNAGTPLYSICAVLTDVTQYVLMRERADTSSRAKSEFLSRMSHEIRTPMNAIIGMTEIMKRQTDDPRLLANINTIVSSSEHLLNIINDVLDISKIESGKLEVSPSPFDLSVLLDGVCQLMRESGAAKNIRLEAQLKNPGALPTLLYGDELRLRQVILNLLSNAVKFSPESGAVTLNASLAPGAEPGTAALSVRVCDQGIGISPENIDKIFGAFEQAGAGIARRYGGTGLGLPISNRLVVLMGGAPIAVKSQLGRGSEFSFSLTLPLSSAAAPGPAQAKAVFEAVRLSGRRILLVDDIDINREIVVALLDGSGAQLDEADDGSSAVERFRASPEFYYDIILMDIQMRDMDGYEAARAIRASGRADSAAVKIIAMSANAFKSDIDTALASGMDDYVVKPIDYDDMLAKITAVLS